MPERDPRMPGELPSEMPIGDAGDKDPMAFPTDPANREDVPAEDLPGSPEQDVLTLDPDDVMPAAGDTLCMEP